MKKHPTLPCPKCGRECLYKGSLIGNHTCVDGRVHAGGGLVTSPSREALTAELTALLADAQGLVDALPKCDDCLRPATRAYFRGGGRYCDEHGTAPGSRFSCDAPEYPRAAPEYPRAAPLRALVARLGKGAR